MDHRKDDKDPDDELDYGMDWSDWLDGDTISASAWAIENGDSVLQLESPANTTTTTTIWLTSGTPGRTYILRNRITTAAGRVKDEWIEVPCKHAGL